MGHKRRVRLGAALVACTLAGCGAQAQDSAPPSVAAEPAAKPTPVATPTPKPGQGDSSRTIALAASPKPERKGLDAPVVWPLKRRPPDPQVGCVDQDGDRLTVVEARADGTSLYLDLVHRSATTPTAYRAVGVTVDLLLDQCPAPPPRVSGQVWEAWPSPSTVAIPLSDLPDGELDLTVRAFGQERTISLRKTGKDLTDLPLEARKAYSYLPGDPTRNIESTVGLEDPVCAKQEVR
jgi:hypothetical protein